MRSKIVSLRQTSAGAPEQWEGKLDTGEDVYARERASSVRVELDSTTIHESLSDDPRAVLAMLFDIAPDAETPADIAPDAETPADIAPNAERDFRRWFNAWVAQTVELAKRAPAVALHPNARRHAIRDDALTSIKLLIDRALDDRFEMIRFENEDT
jgi:transposase